MAAAASEMTASIEEITRHAERALGLAAEELTDERVLRGEQIRRGPGFDARKAGTRPAWT